MSISDELGSAGVKDAAANRGLYGTHSVRNVSLGRLFYCPIINKSLPLRPNLFIVF